MYLISFNTLNSIINYVCFAHLTESKGPNIKKLAQ